MAASRNVMVTCGGKWVGMVWHLRRAMAEVRALREGTIVVADMAETTPAGCFADGQVVVPPLADPGYVPALLAACRAHSVRVLVPIIDLDLNRLAPHRAEFEAVGTKVVCPPPALCELCFDKSSFQRFAEAEGLNPPRAYRPDEVDTAAYPLFYKRRRGFGSIGAGVARTPHAMREALAREPDLVVQEFVDAPEVSVDAFVAPSGRCAVRVQRVRTRVVGGEAWQSVTVRCDPVQALADRAISALAARGLRGPLNVQVFCSDPPRINEVNPRLGSASVFSNFACDGRLFRAVLAGACGEEVDGNPEDYRVGLQLRRFLGDVYF
ncbi:MAG TPA: ATP-grasp domain-containing protein, partial [Vicinamibacteria bacterium]|nr:ATP-grasp domain-containing protein [Vicinamibacteria bacterium]